MHVYNRISIYFKTYYHLLILMSYSFLVHQQQVVTASLLSGGLLFEQLYADLMMLVKSKELDKSVLT